MQVAQHVVSSRHLRSSVAICELLFAVCHGTPHVHIAAPCVIARHACMLPPRCHGHPRSQVAPRDEGMTLMEARAAKVARKEEKKRRKAGRR